MIRKNDKEITKGIISISSCYTICHLCGNILVRTFIENNDLARAASVYIICGNCIKTLPEIVQEKLKHPVAPKIYR